MSFLARVHIYCFLLSYLLALGLEAYVLLRRNAHSVRLLVPVPIAAGLLAHTAYLITRSQQSGLPPLLASQQDWLLVLAWLGVTLYFILFWTHPRQAHGVFMLPAVVVLVSVALFVSNRSAGNLHEIALKRWGMFHAASLVLGLAAVLGASISGLMYLLHHQRLKSRSGWLRNLSLPNLEKLTAINRWMVVFSVPCLTLGLLTGFLLISWSIPDQDVRWSDPTIVTSVIVWAAMVALLIRLLATSQQTGKSVAQLSLLSGGFLLVTVLGPMLLAGSGNLSTFHGRPPSETTPPVGHAETNQAAFSGSEAAR